MTNSLINKTRIPFEIQHINGHNIRDQTKKEKLF